MYKRKHLKGSILKTKLIYPFIINLFLNIPGIFSLSAQNIDYSGYVSTIGSELRYKPVTNYKYETDISVRQRNNLTYYTSDKLTFHLEFQEQYSSYISENDFKIKADRFYGSYMNNNWEVDLGRQRVNWGRTLIWNPNDIFNTFSFYDIDYPERSGSDALRLIHSHGMASSSEIVVKYVHDELSAAFLTKFNKYGYDFQFLGGYMNNSDLTAGLGWEGNIGPIAFRGEGTWYYTINNKYSEINHSSCFLGTLSLDYSINSRWKVQSEVLYNGPKYLTPISEVSTLISSAPSSSKSLSFSEYNVYTGISYIPNAIITANISTIYYTSENSWFIMPDIEISLLQDLNLGIILQHFSLEINGKKNNIDDLFIRLKYYFK